MKKSLAFFVVFAMLISFLPQTATAATPTSIDLSTVTSGGNGYTCEEITVNGKTEYAVTITAQGDYELTGTVTQDVHPTHVIVSAAQANITLNNVSITLVNFSPFAIKPGASVNLTLAAGTENTLSLGASEVSAAGLSVPTGASVVIGGTGKLTARGGSAGNGAGIGGGFQQFVPNPDYDRDAGTITINSGVIDAVGGPYGAGIGGASKDISSTGIYSTIIINGGEVTAKSSSTGSASGAGIGGGYWGGSDVTINGGTVIAQGGNDYAEAIGSGSSYIPSTVKIFGGSVRPLSPMRVRSTTPRNASANVYLTTVTVQDNGGSPIGNREFSCQVGAASFTAKTDGNGKLYLWLPEGNNTVVASSGGVMYRAAGSVQTDDGTVLTALEVNPCAEVNGTIYETWAEVLSAVQADQTIKLLSDVELPIGDQLPAVACTIDGGTSRHKLTLNGQSLLADITLKDLILKSNGPLNCAGHNIRVVGTVEAEGNIYPADGSQFIVDGNLNIGEYGEIRGFDYVSVAAGTSVSAFKLKTTSATIDGTVMCKYFNLGSVSGDPGLMSGNGQFVFIDSGGESANIVIASNAHILSGARITLGASGYTPYEGEMLVEAANGYLDRFVLGSGYLGFKLKYSDMNEEYQGYVLKSSTPLSAPSVSLAPDTVNGGLTYTITPASGEAGVVSGYLLQLLGSDGTTEVGGAIACGGTSGTIPLSSVVLSGSSYSAKVKAIAGADSDYTDSGYSAACAAAQAASTPGYTDAQAVAAAKDAIVGGNVNVAYGATQEQKTAAVQSYVNGIIGNTPNAVGVTATVTYNSGNQYNVALSKGGTSDSKIIAMTVTQFTQGGTGDGGYTPPADTTVYNAPSQSNATIWISGGGLSANDLLVTQDLKGGRDYNALLMLADKNDVLRLYDIFLKSGKTPSGAAYLTFDLDDRYAGQAFTLVHKKADGTFEYFHAMAGADGKVKFGPLYELSPFMLVKGTLLQVSAHGVTDVPNTGDIVSPIPYVLFAFAILCGMGALIYARKFVKAQRR